MRRLSFSLLAAVSTIALTQFASAADMPARAPMYTKAPVMAPVYDWTGFYLGGNVGYGWGANTGSGYSSFTDSLGGLAGFFAAGGNVLPGVNPNGIIGGGQIGYNWQISPWVLGIVADIQASDMKASGTGAASIGAFTSITESKTAKIDWFGTVRAKVGYAVNNVLFYGTGGLAYGEVNASTSFNDPSAGGGPRVFAGSSSSTKTGWAAGAGVDYALSRNWTVGAEYLYVDLGTISTTETQVSGPANASTFTSNSKFTANIARLTINYKFGP